MKYKAPTMNGKEYWVPIVVKNRDHLVGYLEGMKLMEDMILDSLSQNGIDINIRSMELFLDSLRFNDILQDGRRESELNPDEKRQMLFNLVDTKLKKINDTHIENNINDDSILSIECLCNLGFYFWESVYDIPNENFYCIHCGRLLIDYTNVDDSEFDFDG
ncbi:MAG: hypothetical protein ACOC33_01655 [bacterium]